MTGPGDAATTRTETPKSLSFFSIRRDVNSRVSAPMGSFGVLPWSSKSRGGRPDVGISWNKGFCLSRCTRCDWGTCTSGGSM